MPRATREYFANIEFNFSIFTIRNRKLNHISRQHAFVLKGMLEHWMHGWNITTEQVIYATGILKDYGIELTSSEYIYAGRWRDADDIAQVRRWFQECFSDWHDPQLIQDIMGRAKNRQYRASSSALYCDVREGLEDSYPVSVTMELFLESLRGEGDPVVRMGICLLLETSPSQLWGHLFQNPRGIARLQADDRRFSIILQRWQ